MAVMACSDDHCIRRWIFNRVLSVGGSILSSDSPPVMNGSYTIAAYNSTDPPTRCLDRRDQHAAGIVARPNDGKHSLAGPGLAGRAYGFIGKPDDTRAKIRLGLGIIGCRIPDENAKRGF